KPAGPVITEPVSVELENGPDIEGDPVVGKTLTGVPAEYTGDIDGKPVYEWLVNGKVVDTGKKLKLAKKYLGEPVVFRMTVVESRTDDKITWESDEIGPVEAAEAPEKPGDSDEDLEGKISVLPSTTLHPGQDFAVKLDDDL